jgi:hypothetical protein
MGKTLEEQQKLAKEIEEAKTKVEVGAKYRHYKSDKKIYEVLGIGIVEATNELCVIYQAKYDLQLTYLRPVNVWLEDVEWEGETVPRFTKI